VTNQSILSIICVTAVAGASQIGLS